MFEQAVLVSEAIRKSAPQMQGTLRMAMKGCLKCGTRQMIAEPVLGICTECGDNLQVIDK
jgi:hypothetical protein